MAFSLYLWVWWACKILNDYTWLAWFRVSLGCQGRGYIDRRRADAFAVCRRVARIRRSAERAATPVVLVPGSGPVRRAGPWGLERGCHDLSYHTVAQCQ
jgi:hypothetical protein